MSHFKCCTAVLVLLFVVSGCSQKNTSVPPDGTQATLDAYTDIIQGLENRVGSLERDRNQWKTRAQKSELDLAQANERVQILSEQTAETFANPEFLNTIDELDRRISQMSTATGDVELTALPENKGYKITILGDVLFDSGKATIRKEGKTVLTSLVDVLVNTEGRIRIDGHTDNVKIAKPETKAKFPQGNWQLGATRAMNVLLFLKTKGVPEPKMFFTSWGEFQPRAENKKPEDRRRNRRVEIFVLFDSE